MTTTAYSGRRRSWPTIAAVALVPLLAVGALLGLVDRDGDERIEAAVVNLDQAVTVGDQMVPLGRQLAAAMLERDGANISWTLADAPSAAAGLKTGDFSAVVTIPQSFSAAATSFSENDAEQAEQATIQVQVSENAPVTDATVAQQIARLATDTINSTLTEGYLDGIYVGFNTVGEQFATIVDGAEQLSDGATQLADGAEQSAQGSTQLSDGMTQLDANGPALVDGGDQLVEGIRELGSGAGQLSTGAAQLADGAGQLADGVDEFAAQAPQLVDGVGQLADGADQLLPQIPAYADGAAQAIGGVTQLRDGLDQVIAGIEGGSADTSQLDELATGARQVADGAAGVSGGLGQVDQSLQAFASGAAPMPSQVSEQVVGAFECPLEDPVTCAALEQSFAAGVAAGFQAGTGTASTMLNTPDPDTGASLIGGAQQLAGGADQLADGVDQLVTELPQRTAEQMGELTAGLGQLRDGADEIVTQAAPIVDAAPALGSGAVALNDGIQELDTEISALPGGVNQLATGARELAGGADQLADGVSQLDSGVGALEEGSRQYVNGIYQYTQGLASAARGSEQLTAGLVQLSDGVDQLADGVDTFATELAAGADQVPSYSAQDRAALATVVASPVAQPDDLPRGNEVGLTALLLVAGLWLGALVSFVVARPIPRNVVSSRASSVALWARTVAVPLAIVVGQGVVLGLVGSVLLDLGFAKGVGLIALMVVLGASFLFVNHALAGWLGNLGRGISLVLLAVTVALGLTSAAGWLSPVGAVSPLHNGLRLTQTWLADGSGEVALATVTLLMAVLAIGFSVTAIASKRRLTAAQFRRAA